MPTLFPLVFVYLLSLLVLSGVVLGLHWGGLQIGLMPLSVFLGGIIVIIQLFPKGGSLPGVPPGFGFGSYVLFPAVLLGVLLIYIINGSRHAQALIIGLTGFALFLTWYSWMYELFAVSGIWGGIIRNAILPATRPVRAMLASGGAMAIDFFVLTITYQGVSNWRNRHPSRTAGLAALLASLWADSLIYSFLAYAGSSEWWPNMLTHLAGKTAAGFTLWIMLLLYLKYLAPCGPDSAVAAPRPALSILSRITRAEEHARYQQSLLRTLIQINQLTARATDARSLLQQACDTLIETRDYRVVWMAPIDESGVLPSFIACAGEAGNRFWEKFDEKTVLQFHQAGLLGEAIILNDIRAEKERGDLWQETMAKIGGQSAGLFPMRYMGKVFGLVGIFANRANFFNHSEQALLQELADDLAYALVNLETRNQQLLLQKSAETMKNGLLILDARGEIIYANQIISQLTGIKQDELRKRHIKDLLTPQQQERLSWFYAKLSDEGAVIFDFPYQHQGNATTLSITATLGRDSHQEPTYIVINVQDVTSQRQYEKRLLALHHLAADLVQIHDPDQLIHTFLQTGENLLGADASSMYLSDATKKITRAIPHNLPDAYVKFITGNNLQGMPVETAQHTLRPVYLDDTLNNPVYQEKVQIIAKHGFRSLIILPVTYQNLTIGALALYYHQPRKFSEADVQIGMTLAHTLAISYQNAIFYQEESQQRKLAEALAQAAAVINKSLQLDNVLDQILEQLMRVVPCHTTNIVLVESGQVILAHRRGNDRLLFSKTFFVNTAELMNWETYRIMSTEKEPVFIPDTQTDDRWTNRPNSSNVRSYIGMPLLAGERVVGFLNINNNTPNALKAEYLPQLKIFADYAAAAIENARLYTNIIQRAEENAALLAAASIAAKSLDFLEVLQGVARQMLNIFPVDACTILGYDANQRVVSVLLRHFADGSVDIPSKRMYNLNSYALLQDIIDKGEPYLLRVDDPLLSDNGRACLEDEEITSMVLLPLILREHTIGLVALVNKQDERSFSVREITLGLSMASHAAAAIENARLYHQLQEHATDLENRVQQRTRQLQEITEYLEGILSSVPEAVFVFNEKHTLAHANQAGETLRKQAQEIGLDLLDPALLKTLERDSLPTMQSLIEVQGKSYQVVSSSLEGKNGRPGGKIVVFRDVTHFRELDQMKTQFVSDVSHELRTPLTNLTLYLDLLALANNPDRQAAYIQTLKRETGRLAHLIEDLLTISRLEAGRIQFQIRPVDINQIVANLVSDRIFLAAQKEIELKFSPAQTLPLAAVDENMLTQAISNLLTNATNYTQAGGSIFVSTARPSTGWLTIRVADTGVGIAPEESRRIFERFYRGNASRVTGAEGTGLGLAISQEIIQRMGGKITVNSVPGEGSTFTIWLPEFAENDK